MLTNNVKEATLIACIQLFLCGMDASFAADLKGLIQTRTITLIEASVIGSINLYARILGAIVAGYIVNSFGRKNSILVSLLLNTAAWIIIAFLSYTIEIIYVGRICSGIASGMRTVVILYVSEVAHKSRRGKLLAFCGLSTSAGIGFTYLIQYFCSPKMVSVCAFGISFFGSILVCFLYETKYWLLMKNRFQEAERSILWFNDALTEKDALEEIKEIQIQQRHAIQNTKFFTICKHLSFVKHLIICMLIFSLRTASGRTPILVHPNDYYKLFLLPISPEITTLIQGMLEIVFSLLNLVIADSFPRKSMLQIVCWTMSTCLIVSYFQVTLVEKFGILGEWIILIALMLYIGLACGFLFSLTMITVAEIASTITQVRGIILIICQICNNVMGSIYTSFFLIVLASMPVNYILLFMLANLVTLSLLVTSVPETVGKALHKCDWNEENEQKEHLLSETDEENLYKFKDDQR